MQKSDWDARYAASDLVWGSDPNRFVEEALGPVEPGRALDLACGEGRNSIWLAARGWQVTGVDFSRVAIERASELAEARGVKVDWRAADATAHEEAAGRTLVLIAYLQVPRDERSQVLKNAAAALESGGELFMVGHALRNIEDGYGGPSSPDVLWDPDELRADVEACGLRVESCQEVKRPVETDAGPRVAIDTLLRARRAA